MAELSTELRPPTDFYDTTGGTVMYRISKEFHFEAAHHLSGLPEGHQCARVHGHSYRVQVHLAATILDPTGFVADFACLRPVGEYLDWVADHRNLNDLIAQPSSELLAEHVYEWVVANVSLPSTVWVEKVCVSETQKSWAEYARQVVTA